MAKPATRARKEQFIASFGEAQVRAAILALFFRYGLAALTDEQIDEITSDMAADAIATTRRNVRNRNIARQRLNAAA